jgi:hypothetical protein|tara:strand:- start:34 stop:207 length:174 start_codon:yes stop_codon:yes gene_type:complete
LKTKQILIIGSNRYLNKEFIIQQLLEQTIKEYNKKINIDVKLVAKKIYKYINQIFKK